MPSRRVQAGLNLIQGTYRLMKERDYGIGGCPERLDVRSRKIGPGFEEGKIRGLILIGSYSPTNGHRSWLCTTNSHLGWYMVSFKNIHKINTVSRGHELILRVKQLETEVPPIANGSSPERLSCLSYKEDGRVFCKNFIYFK
ncbi:hypothetical protein Cni_G18222 [Canna indica]|uniref:Uncharacterized protein n=1 Tax=Canna indica TaxID=4628 RepID=A0AAQ3KIZ7_9LILI|nr:hypothetical protein Cni_G18222 [Canna indica]